MVIRVLLMEELLHHLGCKKPVSNGITTNLNWFAGFLNHQQYEVYPWHPRIHLASLTTQVSFDLIQVFGGWKVSENVRTCWDWEDPTPVSWDGWKVFTISIRKGIWWSTVFEIRYLCLSLLVCFFVWHVFGPRAKEVPLGGLLSFEENQTLGFDTLIHVFIIFGCRGKQSPFKIIQMLALLHVFFKRIHCRGVVLVYSIQWCQLSIMQFSPRSVAGDLCMFVQLGGQEKSRYTDIPSCCLWVELPSLKLTFSYLKFDGWKMILSFWVSAFFSGAVAVSFREGFFWSRLYLPPHWPGEFNLRWHQGLYGFVKLF